MNMVTFFGEVVDVADPEMLGRVRVQIFNLTEEIPNDELPWATLAMPAISASYRQIGISPTGIEVGSQVYGFFIDGTEYQYPVVLFTFNKIPGKNVKNHDVSLLAREQNKIKKKRVGPEPESAYAAKYPYNKVISTKSGHEIEIDDTPGQERIHLYHRTGTYTEINKKGRRVSKTVDDDYEIIVKNKQVYIKGNLNIVVEGNAKVDVKGNVDLTAKGHINGETKSSLTLKSTAPMTLQSKSLITLKAPRIDLNPAFGTTTSEIAQGKIKDATLGIKNAVDTGNIGALKGMIGDFATGDFAALEDIAGLEEFVGSDPTALYDKFSEQYSSLFNSNLDFDLSGLGSNVLDEFKQSLTSTLQASKISTALQDQVKSVIGNLPSTVNVAGLTSTLGGKSTMNIDSVTKSQLETIMNNARSAYDNTGLNSLVSTDEFIRTSINKLNVSNNIRNIFPI
jgi:hypothetical protein